MQDGLDQCWKEGTIKKGPQGGRNPLVCEVELGQFHGGGWEEGLERWAKFQQLEKWEGGSRCREGRALVRESRAPLRVGGGNGYGA